MSPKDDSTSPLNFGAKKGFFKEGINKPTTPRITPGIDLSKLDQSPEREEV